MFALFWTFAAKRKAKALDDRLRRCEALPAFAGMTQWQGRSRYAQTRHCVN
jgi:hypothetical protein